MERASKPNFRSTIEARFEKIGRSWEKALRAKSRSEKQERTPYDKANNKLKRAIYRVVRENLKDDLINVLKESVEQQFGNKSRIKPSSENIENPFYWGIMAVCGTDNQLPRSTKSRFARELLYAHMHDVPPQFLVGFIYQIGSSGDLQRKINDREMQSWFKNDKGAVTQN